MPHAIKGAVERVCGRSNRSPVPFTRIRCGQDNVGSQTNDTAFIAISFVHVSSKFPQFRFITNYPILSLRHRQSAENHSER